MTAPKHALRARSGRSFPRPRPEPLGDRPAVFDVFGDVWQRYGPAGSNSWWSAARSGQDRGWTWAELWRFSEGVLIGVHRPPAVDLAYTTDSIPQVR